MVTSLISHPRSTTAAAQCQTASASVKRLHRSRRWGFFLFLTGWFICGWGCSTMSSLCQKQSVVQEWYCVHKWEKKTAMSLHSSSWCKSTTAQCHRHLFSLCIYSGLHMKNCVASEVQVADQQSNTYYIHWLGINIMKTCNKCEYIVGLVEFFNQH